MRPDFSLQSTPEKAGFTLIEALVSIIILSICVVALFAGLHAGFTLVNEIRENIIASSILQEEIEELRKTVFSGIPDPFDNASLSLLTNATGEIKIEDTAYSGGDLVRVRVIVVITWNSRLRSDKQNTKRMATIITKNGINSI
jgi:prepilin-type N-terminal cleavage/methylation domain-containing protein